jgi:hyperosmotically inducible protein
MKIIVTTVGTVTLAAAMLSGCDRGNRDAASPAPAVQGLPAEAERQVERAGATLDDASVTAKVKAALIGEPGLTGLAIDVDTSQNVVTLTGSVGSDDLRAQAERTARSVEGVKDVRNNLELKQPG